MIHYWIVRLAIEEIRFEVKLRILWNWLVGRTGTRWQGLSFIERWQDRPRDL